VFAWIAVNVGFEGGGDSVEQQISTMADALKTTTPVQAQSYAETEEIDRRQRARRDAYQAAVDAIRATPRPTSDLPRARPRGAGRPRAQATRSSQRSGDSGPDDDGPGEPPRRASRKVWRTAHELKNSNRITFERRLSWASTRDEIDRANVEERLRGVAW
jgi:hypothetical protein